MQPVCSLTTIARMDNPSSKPAIKPSQGVHIVLDRSFLQSNSAIMIPRTVDGRVLFAIPWYNEVVVGTTDTPLDVISLEPVADGKGNQFYHSGLQKNILLNHPAAKISFPFLQDCDRWQQIRIIRHPQRKFRVGIR